AAQEASPPKNESKPAEVAGVTLARSEGAAKPPSGSALPEQPELAKVSSGKEEKGLTRSETASPPQKAQTTAVPAERQEPATTTAMALPRRKTGEEEAPQELKRMEGHTGWVKALAVSPD